MRNLILIAVLAVALIVVGLFVSGSAPAEPVNFTGTLEEGDLTFEDTGEFYDLYEIELEAGHFADLYVSSDTVDTYLIIEMPDGEEINIDDYYTGDTNAGFLFLVPETGTYTFYISSNEPGETGDYKFTCAASETKLEKLHEGELSKTDDVSWKGGEYFDRYELTLKPNEVRALTMLSPDFDAHLAIHKPSGFVAYVNGRYASTTIQADENGGDYVLIATSKEAQEVGKYTLEIHSFVEE